MNRGPRPCSFTRHSNAKLWQKLSLLFPFSHVRLIALQFPKEFLQPTRTFQLATQEIEWRLTRAWSILLCFHSSPPLGTHLEPLTSNDVPVSATLSPACTRCGSISASDSYTRLQHRAFYSSNALTSFLEREKSTTSHYQTRAEQHHHTRAATTCALLRLARRCSSAMPPRSCSRLA